jgi:hypothetical protein
MARISTQRACRRSNRVRASSGRLPSMTRRLDADCVRWRHRRPSRARHGPWRRWPRGIAAPTRVPRGSASSPAATSGSSAGANGRQRRRADAAEEEEQVPPEEERLLQVVFIPASRGG